MKAISSATDEAGMVSHPVATTPASSAMVRPEKPSHFVRIPRGEWLAFVAALPSKRPALRLRDVMKAIAANPQVRAAVEAALS